MHEKCRCDHSYESALSSMIWCYNLPVPVSEKESNCQQAHNENALENNAVLESYEIL